MYGLRHQKLRLESCASVCFRSHFTSLRLNSIDLLNVAKNRNALALSPVTPLRTKPDAAESGRRRRRLAKKRTGRARARNDMTTTAIRKTGSEEADGQAVGAAVERPSKTSLRAGAVPPVLLPTKKMNGLSNQLHSPQPLCPRHCIMAASRPTHPPLLLLTLRAIRTKKSDHSLCTSPVLRSGSMIVPTEAPCSGEKGVPWRLSCRTEQNRAYPAVVRLG
jgi:hypothetical protein